jgi:integrase/recombinase XerD
MEYLLHDTRYTCASLMDRAGVNDSCKKLILGHAKPDVTQETYMQKDLLDLINAIDMI